MANLGFLSEEQKKNIWGQPETKTYIDTSVQAEIPQNFAEVDDQPQLLTDIATSSLDPNLKQWSDQSYQIYQNAIKAYSRYGNKGARVIQWYENQARKYSDGYKGQYDNAMQSAVGDALKKAKPKNTAEAYAALSSILPDPDDYKKYAEPYLEMMGVGKETGKRRMYKAADGFNYWADTNERVNPDIQKAGAGRKTIKGADGYQYFIDTGERVLPDVVKTSSTTGDKVPTAFQDEAFLLNRRKELSNLTEGTPEYKLAAQELQTYEDAYTNQLWEGASTQRRKWSETVGEFSYTSDLINRMFTQLNDPRVTTGALASGLGFFEGIASQAQQGYSLVVESFKDAEGEPILAAGTLNAAELYDWNEAAELSGAFKANITDLAYSLARMAEPGGRLSTPDVQNQIDRIAPQGRMSKSGIAQALLEIDRSIQSRLRSQYAGLKASNLPVDDFKFPRGRLEERTRTDPKTGQQFHALVYNTNKQVPSGKVDEKGEPIMEDGYAVVLQWPVGN